MDLTVPTIAQRKAARRSQVTAPESTSQHIPTTGSQTSDESFTAPVISSQHTSSASTVNLNTSALSTVTQVQTSTVKTEGPSAESTDSSKIDKETLIALARSLGLEVTAPKKIWIKHSYSVTPESKEKFANYCDVLGIKMQDGLEEAFQDWFKKKEVEFKAIHEAKNG
jgi:hypothetical protein